MCRSERNTSNSVPLAGAMLVEAASPTVDAVNDAPAGPAR